MKLNFEFWVSYEANKPIIIGFNRNLYFQPFWPTKARQYLMLWKSRFLRKLPWNRQKSHGLTTNNGSFEMTRLWDFQKYPIFENLRNFDQILLSCANLYGYIFSVSPQCAPLNLWWKCTSIWSLWFLRVNQLSHQVFEVKLPLKIAFTSDNLALNFNTMKPRPRAELHQS